MRSSTDVSPRLEGGSLRASLRRLLAAAALGLAAAGASALPFSLAGGASGQEAGTEQVKGRLLVPVDAVQPGQTVAIGLRQRIADGWHTYWANPGDSGLPTTIAFTAPAGTRAGPIEWPVPERFDIGPITNYGYGGEVTLLTRLTVPADLAPGSQWAVQADVRWLVCSDVCIPQDLRFAFRLPVRTAPGAATADAAAIEAARAALPTPLDARPTWTREDRTNLTLRLPVGSLPAHDRSHFFAGVPLQVTHAAPQGLQRLDDGWRLSVTAGETPPASGDAAIGVLVLQAGGRSVAALAIGGGSVEVVPTVKPPAANGDPSPPAPAPAPFRWAELLAAAAFALLGGLVLNLMPCVFPVLSIKALSLVRQSEGPAARTLRLQGLAYTAGVLVCFLGFAGALLALRSAGDAVGWGFQFQSPVFVLGMALLLFALGLQLSGVWSWGSSVAGIGQALTERPGASGSFFTGALAAVVATPCTAPFMGAAVGYALAQPAAVTAAVFIALGLGLALPYLALTWVPALHRRLPRPGPWMDRFKQFLAFPMYASAAWLAWVLAQQSGPPAVAVLLAAAVAVAFAAWLWSAGSPARAIGGGRAARLGWASGALAGLIAVASVTWAAQSVRGGAMQAAEALADPSGAGALAGAADGSAGSHRIASGWTPYTPERLQVLRREGQPVFVNLTAAWCITCLVNERVALDIDRVDRAFVDAGITRLKGDWTRGDPRITALLAEHGRSGVPLYLMYPAGGGGPVLLPQILTPDLVIEAIAVARGAGAVRSPVTGPAPSALAGRAGAPS